MCETSQVSPGAPRPAPAATGRPRSAQQVSWRPCVQTAKTGSGCGVSPGDRPAPERLDVEVVHLVDVVEHGGLQPRLGVVGVRREDPQPAPGGSRRPGRRMSSTRTRGRRGPGGQLVAEPVGQPGVAQGVLAPGPGVLQQQERADRRGGAGDRLVPRQARRRRSGSARHRPRTSSSPSRTSLRHSTSLLCSSSGRSAGLSSPRARISLERRPEPGRHVERAVAEQHLEAVARVEQHARVAGPAAQPGVVGRGPRRR